MSEPLSPGYSHPQRSSFSWENAHTHSASPVPSARLPRLIESVPLYLRIESADPDEVGLHAGAFTLLRRLRESGRLAPADARRAAELVDLSYQVHQEPPAQAFEHEPRGLSWFLAHAESPDAPVLPADPDVRDLIDGVIALLTRYQCSWRQVVSENPGRVTYADDVQIVAIPVAAPGHSG